ncbi:hypothetical protein ALC57_11273 [Trachymyrmex cornetzi]|uniref:Uncharacterized protein n=1 Tax=Trachymyrmex cornetzi TaxID=471704 RepID=A0A195DU45_9HYME|nr:hypothetical protein ALC57_11273 [Trachymyrmex cornetzi]
MRPPRPLTAPPLPLVLYVSVLKRAPLCVMDLKYRQKNNTYLVEAHIFPETVVRTDPSLTSSSPTFY